MRRRARDLMVLNGCLSNLSDIGLALAMYDPDGERLPPTKQWMDNVSLYLSSPSILHCPGVAKESKDEFGYAMRRKYGGILTTTIPDWANEPLIFDSNLTQKNAATDEVEVPGFSRHPQQSVLFADGHSSIFRKTEVGSKR